MHHDSENGQLFQILGYCTRLLMSWQIIFKLQNTQFRVDKNKKKNLKNVY